MNLAAVWKPSANSARQGNGRLCYVCVWLTRALPLCWDPWVLLADVYGYAVRCAGSCVLQQLRACPCTLFGDWSRAQPPQTPDRPFMSGSVRTLPNSLDAIHLPRSFQFDHLSLLYRHSCLVCAKQSTSPLNWTRIDLNFLGLELPRIRDISVNGTRAAQLCSCMIMVISWKSAAISSHYSTRGDGPKISISAKFAGQYHLTFCSLAEVFDWAQRGSSIREGSGPLLSNIAIGEQKTLDTESSSTIPWDQPKSHRRSKVRRRFHDIQMRSRIDMALFDSQ